jgi:hypothetical protein
MSLDRFTRLQDACEQVAFRAGVLKRDAAEPVKSCDLGVESIS